MLYIVETKGRTLEEMSRLFGIETSLAERDRVKPTGISSPQESIEDVVPPDEGSSLLSLGQESRSIGRQDRSG